MHLPSISLVLAIFSHLASTSPIVEISEAKGNPIKPVDCGGTLFTKDQIYASKVQMSLGQRGRYPETYSNSVQGKNPKIFGTPKQLKSFPLMDPVYTTGVPGKYRVVTLNATEDWAYQGCMYHFDNSDLFKKCVNT